MKIFYHDYRNDAQQVVEGKSNSFSFSVFSSAMTKVCLDICDPLPPYNQLYVLK